MLDPIMLDMLACPACDERPAVRQVGSWIFCDQCHRAYPIKDDLPLMLIEESVKCENGQPPTEPPA